MRHNLILSALAVLSAGTFAFAQSKADSIAVAQETASVAPEKTRTDSLGAIDYAYGMQPLLDSAAVNILRHRMDSIRETCGRPTVALVLSGGGARGSAHVGALQYIEEVGIPVDIVLGTSMGGLVGGFYAMGYSPAEMKDVLKRADWNYALNDEIPKEYLSYMSQDYKERYLFALPFYSSRDTLRMSKMQRSGKRTIRESLEKLRKEDKASGINGRKKGGMLNSVPFGLYQGQNVYNIINYLAVGYQGEMSFSKLPIPYICVTADMVTGKPKVWYSGKLPTAMRGTMSIPMLFTPIKMDDMVLVDGGIRDNYPVDIAKLVGADYVVGVDLSKGYRDASRLNNMLDLTSATIEMLGRDSYERNSGGADVEIRPNTQEFGMLSFEDEAIDTLVQRGYAAARSQGDKLRALKAKVGGGSKQLCAPKATNLATTKVSVSAIEIEGVTTAEKQYILKMLDKDITKKFGKDDVEDLEAQIVGTGAFELVTYRMDGDGEPYTLVFECRKGPRSRLGIGARADTETMASLLLNLGINVNSISGSALDATVRLSNSPCINLLYYYSMPSGLTINAEAFYGYHNDIRFNMFNDNNIWGTTYFHQLWQQIYLSNINWKWMDLSVGVLNEYIKGSMLSSGEIQDKYGFMENTYKYYDGWDANDLLNLFAWTDIKTMDDSYFPTRGISFHGEVNWYFASLKEKLEKPFFIAKCDFKAVIPITGKFHALPFASARTIFGENKLCTYYANVIGGRMAGRFMDHQVPFAGINGIFYLPKMMGIAGAELRYNISGPHYLSAIANYGTASDKFSHSADNATKQHFFGAALQYSYNAMFGPVTFDVHWSDLTKKFGIYASIGYDF